MISISLGAGRIQVNYSLSSKIYSEEMPDRLTPAVNRFLMGRASMEMVVDCVDCETIEFDMSLKGIV